MLLDKKQTSLVLIIISLGIISSIMFSYDAAAFNRPLTAIITNGIPVQPASNGTIPINTIGDIASTTDGTSILFSINSFTYISTPTHIIWESGSGTNYFDETMNINSNSWQGVQHSQTKSGTITTITLDPTENDLTSPLTMTLLKNGSPTNILFIINPHSPLRIFQIGYDFNSGDSLQWIFIPNTSSSETYSFNVQTVIKYNN